MKNRPRPFNFFYLVWICSLAFVFVSCDPAQSILIENKTDSEATITFVFNQGHHDYKFSAPGESDTLSINLEKTGQDAVREFQFGLGTWKIQSSLDSLIAAIAVISIETVKSKEIFNDEKQIREFLESRISGSQKEVIEIRLE